MFVGIILDWFGGFSAARRCILTSRSQKLDRVVVGPSNTRRASLFQLPLSDILFVNLVDCLSSKIYTS